MNAAASNHFPTFGKFARAILRLIRSLPGKCLALMRWIQRFFFSRTSFKCYVVIATLICLTYTTLRWIGRRAWQAENERAAAAGMATDRLGFVTPMPRDEDNFLAADIFRGLSDGSADNKKLKMWFSKTKYAQPLENRKNRESEVPKPKKNTLAEWCEYFRKTGMLPAQSSHRSPAAELLADQRWQPTIEAIFTAAARPSSRFPAWDHRERSSRPDMQIDPRVLFSLHKSILLYSEAQLELSNPSQAIPAFNVTKHLVEAHAAEPGYIPLLKLLAFLRAEFPLLQSGMRLHRLSAPVLQDLLTANYPERLPEITRRAIQFERATCCSTLQNFPESFNGSSWARDYPTRNFVLERLLPDYFPMCAAVRTSQHYARLHEAAAPLGTNEPWNTRIDTLADMPNLDLGTNYIFGNNAPGWSPMLEFNVCHVIPAIQVSIRHLAITLELHYLLHSKYPPSLDQLDSSIAVSPHLTKDIDGQAIRYQTNPERSHFTVYSVGMDGVENSPIPYPDDNIVFSTDPGRP